MTMNESQLRKRRKRVDFCLPIRKRKGARGRGRVHQSRKASKLTGTDYISAMPEEVITNILHCLPLHDIMKTSTLSKDWRYKCTMITQLVFDEKFYEYLKDTVYEEDYVRIIDHLLLLLNGAITKFVLLIPYTIRKDDKQINDWIIYLSKKGIKEFAFSYDHYQGPEWTELLELTPDLFSCLELTHLELDNCVLPLIPPEFGGFPKLLRLYLSRVTFKGYKGWECFTRSPLVEILKTQHIEYEDKLIQVEIGKPENLKSLSMFVHPGPRVYNFFQRVASLAKVQELTLHFWGYRILTNAGNRVPIFLPCLKTLDLYDIDFGNGDEISYAIDLICGSPNLATLSIKAVHDIYEDSSSEVDFRRMTRLQLLQKVTLASIQGVDSEVCLIKYILKRSPLLKKIDIYFGEEDWKGRRRRKFERKLQKLLNRYGLRLRDGLRLPFVEIDIIWGCSYSVLSLLPMQHNQLFSEDSWIRHFYKPIRCDCSRIRSQTKIVYFKTQGFQII